MIRGDRQADPGGAGGEEAVPAPQALFQAQRWRAQEQKGDQDRPNLADIYLSWLSSSDQ